MLRVHPIAGNTQRLDGGSMFGNAPRALWSRWCKPDDLGRIPLSCRAVLVDDGSRKILLETGVGTFFEPRLKERYGVVEAEHVLLHSLASLGVREEDVDIVVLSHLHFDHAGGLLAAYSPDARPRLLFPNASFVVGRTAFERAKHPHLRDRASFVAGLTDLLGGTGRLELVGPGVARIPILAERFEFAETDGHTPGLLHTSVLGSKGKLFYCSDLVPGVPWLRLPITMGYDRFPEKLVDEKSTLLGRCARDGTWLAFTHDPDVALCRIEQGDKGEFRIVDARRDDSGWLDLE